MKKIGVHTSRCYYAHVFFIALYDLDDGDVRTPVYVQMEYLSQP